MHVNVWLCVYVLVRACESFNETSFELALVELIALPFQF